MKAYTLDEAEDFLIGQKGTKEREDYEFELKLELIGDMIKIAKKKRKLTLCTFDKKRGHLFQDNPF